MIKICPICKKEFNTRASKVKTCSRKCGYAFNRQRNALKAKTKIPPGVIDRRPNGRKFDEPFFKKCVICDKSFAVIKSHRNSIKTCSKECSSEYRKTFRRIHPDIEKNCEFCGKVYTTRNEGKNLKKKLYCSDECRLNALNSKPRPKKKMYKHISRGYVRLTFNNPDGSSYHMLEHRYVMEQKIGRKLNQNERIHHINGIKTDNRPENLMLFSSQSEHIKYEIETNQRIMPERHERDRKGRYI